MTANTLIILSLATPVVPNEIMPPKPYVTPPPNPEVQNSVTPVTPMEPSATVTSNEILTPQSHVTPMMTDQIVTVPQNPEAQKSPDTNENKASSTVTSEIVTPLSLVTPVVANEIMPPKPDVTAPPNPEVQNSLVTNENQNVQLEKKEPVKPNPEQNNNEAVRMAMFSKGIEHKLRNKKEFNYGIYKCGICDKTLTSTEQLKLHIDVVHLSVLPKRQD